MSRLFYFASDVELEDQPNPYLKYLSVNEALSLGIKVNTELLDADSNYDAPDIIVYCEDENNLSYPEFYSITAEEYLDNIGTLKKYCIALQWDYNDKTADVVLQYINKQLTRMPSIEMWNVWLGNVPDEVDRNSVKDISIDSLTFENLRDFFTSDNDYQCLVINK